MYRARPSLAAAVAACTLACLALPAEAGRTFVEVGSGRGLAATVVPSMLVDREGLLWVGSREGLYRYDGYVATAFRPVPGDPGSLSDVDVRALYEGRDGSLWVSTNTAGLNRLDRRTGRFTRYGHDSADPGSLSDPSVYGVAEDASGRVWAGSQRGLNRLDVKSGRVARFFHEPGRAGSLASDWVYALHVGTSGTLWIGTVGGGIDRWDEAQGQFVNLRPSGLTGGDATLDDIFALHEGPDGRLWAGTRGGLVVVDPSLGTGRLLDLRNGAGTQPLVTAMRPDGSGRLWIATMDRGVMVVDLKTNAVERVAFNRAGDAAAAPPQPLLSIATGPHHVFVGTWGAGVFRAPLENPPFALLDNGERGLRNRNVTAVLGGLDAGRPWVGSFGGGPQRVDVTTGLAEPTPGTASDRLALSGIVSLARMPDGRIFAGSTEGLFGFSERGGPVALERHDAGQTDGIGAGYVAALLPAANDSLWVGVGGSGLHLRDAAGRYRAFRHDPADRTSLSGNYVTALSPGPAGRLWVGTRSEGLNLCTVDPFACERYANGTGPGNLANHHVTALRNGRDGELWVGTDGGGVHRITLTGAAGGKAAAQITRWGAADGLIDDGIMAVEQDSDGSLWLSTRHGIARFDPASGRVVNHVAESGLPTSHFNTGASSSDATHLYFGSVEGLVSLPRGTALAPRPATPIAVTGVEILGARAAEPLAQAVLDGFRTRHGDGLSIEFAVLDFAESTHEYAYRLDPAAPWTSLGQRRQVTFLDLEPGQHRFEVRGRDVFGHWTASRSLSFEVVPPIWMTPWFRTLAALALLLLAVSLHLARTRSLQARNAVLENLERQREFALERARASQRELEEAYAGLRQLTDRLESAKEDERARISRELHDEFGQTLTAAKITLQMLRQATAEPAVVEGLAQSVGMVDGMIRQARDIARGLRPPLLDEAGLVPALQHHLQTAAGRSGVRIDLDAGPGVADAPAGLNTTVFRIVQEAVSNALRHATPQSIRVALRSGPGTLQVVIDDDGVGFDPVAVGQRVKRGEHLGLLGMTERVRNAGGTIEFLARPGGGSRIEVQLPYAKPVPVADEIAAETRA